ncbi:uncharacterized protein LOC143356274 [Halictus rubicundus]|uniref:uncharacterized protein LOC143356274 n=1 Tax=Halictus rubicundus TaxID=77578 RepID=UPI004036DB7C
MGRERETKTRDRETNQLCLGYAFFNSCGTMRVSRHVRETFRLTAANKNKRNPAGSIWYSTHAQEEGNRGILNLQNGGQECANLDAIVDSRRRYCSRLTMYLHVPKEFVSILHQ